MNLQPQTNHSQYLLAVIPYATTSRPDEKEIRKTVSCYANLNWHLVERCESLDGTEDGQFSLLQFKHVM